jgi:hypothetical protein
MIHANSCTHHKIVVEFGINEFLTDHLVAIRNNADKTNATKKEPLFWTRA